jgi:hypothetical protein
VAEEDGARPIPDRPGELLRLDAHERGAGELPRPDERAVLVPRRQHLVSRREPERAEDGVQRRGGVLREREVLRPRPHEGGELGANAVEEPLEPARDQLDRVALQLALPVLVRLEHRPRAGAVAAVVQERDARIEEVAGGHAAASVSR